MRKTIGRLLDHQSRRFFKNSSWAFTANVVAVLCVFAQSVILGRSLGVSVFGAYILLMVVIETTREFLNFGADVAVVRYVADYRTAGKQHKIAAFLKGSYGIALLTSILTGAVISLLLAVPIGYFADYQELAPWILTLAIARSLGNFDNISSALLRVYDHFRLNAIIRICITLTELVLVATVVWFFPQQLKPVFIALTASAVLGSLIRNSAAIFECKEAFTGFLNAKLSAISEQLREIRGFILHTTGSGTIRILLKQGDILILSAFASVEQVGIYAVAKRLSNALLMITDPMYVSLYPQIATLLSDNRISEVSQMLKRISLVLAGPVLVFIVGGWLFGADIVSVVFGSEFRDAGQPLAILIAAVALNAFFFWTVVIILSAGQTRYRLAIDILSLATGAALAIWLVPRHGAVGAAFAVLGVAALVRGAFLWRSIAILSDKTRSAR